jgi:hypothetical protein
MSEQSGPAPRVAGVGPPATTGYTPLVPSFSPYTSDAAAAVRIAWRVTLGAFVVLVALIVGVPLARNWYVNAAVEPRIGQVRPINGVVFLRRQGVGDWLAAHPEDTVAPGDVLRTAQNARAFVTLFDHSTVLLYPSSTLRVLRAEQGRFRHDRRTNVLELSQGRARIGVVPASDTELTFFQLRTPHAEVHLEEGSYSVDVTGGGSQVGARLGLATAYTANGSADAKAGQRLFASAGDPPTGALPFRRDLVGNGYYRDRELSLPSSWATRVYSEQSPEATISLDSRPGAVTFRRLGRGHGEAVISQELDIDLWDFERVVLAAEFRVLEHSLSGGGWEGTEYPLTLRVTYMDEQGRLVPWYRGYYLHNRENNPVRFGYGFGVPVPNTDWQKVEIDLLAQVPRPWRIQSVEVEAAGWDFESAIREMHIWAE